MHGRRIFVVALFFVFAAPLIARDLRPEVVVQGRVAEISMSPSGGLWIGTAMGYAYRSDDGGRTWSEASVPSRKMDDKTVFSDTLDRITFFDARRAMISGWIGEQNDGIFLTENGGDAWRVVQLPEAGFWVYDAQATSDGHAWLVGSTGAVLRSDDYGRTWRKLTSPFDEDERTLSVWFQTPLIGVVGTLSSGALAVTKDGGATWSVFEAQGRDEIVRGCKDAYDQRITKVRIRGGRVIVAQCGGVFTAPLEGPRAWSRLTAGDKAIVDFDLAEEERLIGLADDWSVHEIGLDGHSRAAGVRLSNPLLAMIVHGKRIALLDATLKVAVFDGETWFTSRMFGKGVATSWPIGVLDRGARDVLWGISLFFLYRSDDGAKTWDRIAELPAATQRVHIQSDGNVLLADGHGWVGRWDVSAAKLVDVPVLNGLDIIGSFRRKDLWLLFGGRQFDTAGRVEVAQTFFSGQFAGSVGYGFVAASIDGGSTWSIIDRWDEGPQAIFLSDDNRLTLLSWLCGIRQGTVTREPLAAKMQTLLRGEERERAPYVQGVMVFDLLDGKNGWILGWIHHVGNLAYRTTDGGRSWKKAEAGSYPRYALVRLFDGTWIGVAPTQLQRWTGKKFETLAWLDGEISWIFGDSQGGLSVWFKDGSVKVLEMESRALRTVRGTVKP